MQNGSPYLLVATDSDVQGAFSGYTQLAKYIPHSALLRNRRREPRSLVERAAQRSLNQFTGSKWYRFSSIKPELNAWLRYRKRLNGLVHFLWGERDWGFVDLVPSRHRPKVCATFHTCPDTLPDVLRPNRLAALDGIILMSEHQRSFFLERGVAEEKLEVIPHGVDLRFFNGEQNRSKAEFSVLFVGSYRRRFDLLEDVVKILGRARPSVKFIVIAPGALTARLQDLANVRLPGYVSDEELRSLYSTSSCLLMTLEAATANNAILEAMACELPVVSEDVGGVREYLGETGLLAPAGAANELADAIIALHDDAALAQRIGRRQRQHVEAYDWPVVAERTEKFYRRILKA